MARRLARTNGLVWSGILLVGLKLAGLALFSRGFFPVKPLLASYTAASGTQGADPPFSRLVFVLVDALRSDFAFGAESSLDYPSSLVASNMHFVSSLVASGYAVPLTALAQAPTVTLPRLKALTTGSNPTFLDAIMNLAEDSSSPALENVDSWVRQLAIGTSNDSSALPGRRIAFVGDDTWLRLFPQHWFSWSEGVTSFFVADTQTVDTNVTRHLHRLLNEPAPPLAFESSAPSDWDVLILHYLGLDHVGHLAGSRSPLMAPKQREMDDVIRRVYEGLDRRDREDGGRSLLVLVGDHGMTEMGNHGGSSEGEMAAALLFASPSFRPDTSFIRPLRQGDSPYLLHEVVNQIDIVPTLSSLLGLGIPRNSMGRVVSSVVERYGSAALLQDSLRGNLHQIKSVLEAASPGAVEELTREVASDGSSTLLEDADVSAFLNLAQARLMTTFGDYHIVPMLAGLVLLFAGAIGLFALSVRETSRDSTTTRRMVGGLFLLYLATFFATSFIEEEHQFWYFFTGSTLLVLALRPRISIGERLRFVLASASVRIIRSWSNNGQQASRNFSISSYLHASPTLTLTISLATYTILASIPLFILVAAARRTRTQRLPVSHLFLRAITFAILLVLALAQVGIMVAGSLESVYRLNDMGLGGAVERARAGYALASVSWAVGRLAQRFDTSVAPDLHLFNLSTLSLILVSLTRDSNLPIFVLLWAQYYTLASSDELSPLLMSTLLICCQHVSFFAMGGSNSLATLDLSQAYNGVTTYNVLIVSLQTYLSNFAGSIFLSLAASSLLPRKSHLFHTSTFHSLTLATLALSATHFRRHLFTWTVFSPALLYKGAWSTFFHLGTDVLLAGLL